MLSWILKRCLTRLPSIGLLLTTATLCVGRIVAITGDCKSPAHRAPLVRVQPDAHRNKKITKNFSLSFYYYCPEDLSHGLPIYYQYLDCLNPLFLAVLLRHLSHQDELDEFFTSMKDRLPKNKLRQTMGR